MSEYMLGVILGGILGAVLMFSICVAIAPYKQGQIDAINGKIKYELVVQPDKSVEWCKIEKEEK